MECNEDAQNEEDHLVIQPNGGNDHNDRNGHNDHTDSNPTTGKKTRSY